MKSSKYIILIGRVLLFLTALSFTLILASCQTAPKQPDPFDTMLIDAAKEMFQDVDFNKP